MKLIESSAEIWDQNNLFKHIERCGRICYKSEDKITEDSSLKFMSRIINLGHTSVLEHGTIYLTIPIGSPVYDRYYMTKYDLVRFFDNNNYSFVNKSKSYYTVEEAPKEYKTFVSKNGITAIYYITTNYRVIIENNLKVEPYIVDCSPNHIKRITAHIICDRGVLAEITRHRVFSFSVESTRYCNYSKDKFGGELTFIIPYWLDIKPNSINTEVMSGDQIRLAEDTNKSINFIQSLASSELEYISLINKGCKPQEARAVLPNCLKTELAMTGTISQWEEFFKLRCNKNAHPDMQIVANKLKTLINEYSISGTSK